MNKNKKQKRNKPKIIISLLGILTGLINGFFGSGGGMIAVETLERSGIDSKRSHASSILAILPLSLVSFVVYFLRGSMQFDLSALSLLGGACAGGFIGALFLGRLSGRTIDYIFTAIMLISGIRMVFS